MSKRNDSERLIQISGEASELAGFLCAMIYQYGGGMHPVATPQNLQFFADEYARTCVEKALADPNLSPLGRKLGQKALDSLRPPS